MRLPANLDLSYLTDPDPTFLIRPTDLPATDGLPAPRPGSDPDAIPPANLTIGVL